MEDEEEEERDGEDGKDGHYEADSVRLLDFLGFNSYFHHLRCSILLIQDDEDQPPSPWSRIHMTGPTEDGRASKAQIAVQTTLSQQALAPVSGSPAGEGNVDNGGAGYSSVDESAQGLRMQLSDTVKRLLRRAGKFAHRLKCFKYLHLN